MRRQYPFHLIEPRWQQHWETELTFKAFNPGTPIPLEHPFARRHGADSMSEANVAGRKAPPKYYILDMFPYPSGAGLHVGHPEGYTATDILARYRRAKGFNVLHPMGWDSFGLPAEQYAVKTGQHPRVTTEANIANFTRQIKSLGFSYDWSREVATTDPGYFHWTQWIFLQLYNSWFNPETNKAEPISTLNYPPELQGPVPARESHEETDSVRTQMRNSLEAILERERRAYRDSKRLAYVSEAPVNWCPELGTVLANEEVIDGKSEVGGFPVIRKPMRQWMLRITSYAEKLLADLDTIDWSDSLKEMQRNWIGRSEGAEVDFQVLGHDAKIRVFTTRPDTLFGATYMVLAPEHKLVDQIATSDNVAAYRAQVASKSDLERTDLAKEKSGVFIGAYAINPVNGEKIPIWIADYVLASYGTGAIMAVPAHDDRDFEFARKFDLPIVEVVQKLVERKQKTSERKETERGEDGSITFVQEVVTDFTTVSVSGECYSGEGIAVNSSNMEISLDGLETLQAKAQITAWLEEKGVGRKTINYKLRDWLFSRQRYWGEPFPLVWKKDGPGGQLYHEALPESALPLLPPNLEDYKPTSDGQPPLARAKDWVNLPDGSIRETNTMPQWAGSCWYYLRYLDAKNGDTFVGKEAESYWMGVVGRVSPSAPVGRPPLLNRSDSSDAVRSSDGRLGEAGDAGSEFEVSSFELPNPKPETPNPQPKSTPGVDLYVGGTEHAVLHLLYARFWHKVLFDLGHVSTAEPFFKLVNQGLILGEDGQKMSKSRGNVVNPDDVLKEFGADAFRLYEMFMGPLQDTKPWNTRGVEGVYRFLGRVWRLFIDEQSEKEFELAETTAEEGARGELLNKLKLAATVQDVAATPAQLKTLHACIKKVTEDLDGMRFNTAISAMMVFVNEAMTWETRPVAALKAVLQLLAPFAPHIAEELWAKVNSKFKIQNASLTYSPWPSYDPERLVEDTLEIPVQVNGKLRDVIKVPADADKAVLEASALAAEKVKAFTDGKTVKKIIVVPKKLVNIVVA